MSAGSAVMQHREQAAYSEQVAKSANADAIAGYNDALTRQQEEGLSVGYDLWDAMREVRGAKATAKLAAIETGAEGNSVNASLDAYDRKLGAITTRRREQKGMVVDQINRQMDGISANARSRIASAPRPSLVGLGLQIGQAGLNAYSGYQQNSYITQQRIGATG